MFRERTLKFVMIVSGLIFVAAIYPLVMSLWNWQHADDIVPMFSAFTSRSEFSCS